MSETQWITTGDAISPQVLVKRLKAVTAELRANGNNGNLLSQALFQTAKINELAAKGMVAEKTGRLKRAIKKSRDRKPQFEGATENYQIKVNPGRSRNDLKGAYYWSWYHFGSIHHKGNDFLVKSFEQTKVIMANEFKNQLFKKIELAEKRVKKLR